MTTFFDVSSSLPAAFHPSLFLSFLCIDYSSLKQVIFFHFSRDLQYKSGWGCLPGRLHLPYGPRLIQVHSVLNSLPPMVRLFQCKVLLPVATETDYFLQIWLVWVMSRLVLVHTRTPATSTCTHFLLLKTRTFWIAPPGTAPPGVPLTSGWVFLAAPETLWPCVLTPLPPISASAEDPLFGATLPPILCFRCLLSSLKWILYAYFSTSFWRWIISSKRRGGCLLDTIFKSEVLTLERSCQLWHGEQAWGRETGLVDPWGAAPALLSWRWGEMDPRQA